MISKTGLFAFVLLLLTYCSTPIVTTTPGSNQPTYTNPLPVAFGDPYILNVGGGNYFMYGTGGVRDGFVTYSSNDLVNWKNEGQIFHGN